MGTETAPLNESEHSLPGWRSLLAVVAHPDDESFGLGAVLDQFIAQGTRVTVLCLTEGEASTIGSGINLSAKRRDELAKASERLGITGTVLHHYPDGGLRSVCRHILAGEVIDEAGEALAEGLLVFAPGGVTGHPDHGAATAAGLLAAEVLDLPVLAWTLPTAVADELNEELGETRFRGTPPEQIDLRITVDRTHQIAASQAHHSQAVESSPLWRRLELLGDTEHLCWLRRRTAG